MLMTRRPAARSGAASGATGSATPSLSAGHARYQAARIATAAAVCALYYWIIGIGAVSERFAWNSGLDQVYGLPSHPVVQGSNGVNGYYDLLARAFANGQVSLPVEPAPELLALPDPWSDRINRPYRLLDTVLHAGHYYLYHGVTPVLLLFAPWYRITGHDFPENFATFLFSFGAYLFLSALLLRVFSRLSIRLPLGLFVLFLVTLGVGASVPFLLHRAKVYEVAIACGYFCLTAGFYFLFRLLTDAKRPGLFVAISGICFGLAVGCRPHLAVAAAAAFVALLFVPTPKEKGVRRFLRRDVFAFTIPVVLCGLAIAAYNWARFGNPLEFGIRYMLGDEGYINFHLSAGFARGLYYLLLCPPDLVPEFPFVRLALRQPFFSSGSAVAASYYLEPIAGVLSLCPLILFAPLLAAGWKTWKGQREVLGLLAAVFASAAGSILEIAAVPFATHRYEVDFAPYLVFIACVVAGAGLQTLHRGWWRIAATSSVVALLAYSIAAGLALGVQGPYDQFVQANPGAYVKLARWFSPATHYRPVLNPVVQARAAFQFPATPQPRFEPLLTLGEFGSRYRLSAIYSNAGKIRLVSESSFRYPDEHDVDVPSTAPGLYTVGLEFNPEKRIMTVIWNGKAVLDHPLRFLVTSPSQITFGEDPTFGNQNRFSGLIQSWPPRFLETAGAQ